MPITPNYGWLEGLPVRFTDHEAWVLIDNGKRWEQFPPSEMFGAAALMTEETYQQTFGDLPPLPDQAFSKPAFSK